ncbi:hypothetical protein BN1211_6121 [Cyberlindnera jadinii]|uniref:Uncharacterized protein n=1 Tax=Cyberlindnera jadinii (strain ATCC 18201 / CBS 1600 / BCRC 20928 / JCM 3617 / NBRC 0987 / NRRL Y-1542) TaxID=983966 RepID=A0A0H5C9L5_CYBJN|nr:hypothetical protein BN1211_6121 [Cyberlindnera jadinii]
MTLHGTFQQRPQLGEETSAANPEPQRQFETDGGTTQQEDPNTATEITVLPQQPPLPEPQPLPEPDSGTMADGISVETDVAARALEELKRDGAFDCEPYFEYIMNNDDLFYDEPQQWRPHSSACNSDCSEERCGYCNALVIEVELPVFISDESFPH